MTYGIRTTSTGAWVENCEFGTRAEADAHLRAQFHREWIEKHEVSERSGTMGEQRPYWYDMGAVWTQGPLGPVPVATMGHDLSNVVNDDSMGERIAEMLNALAGIPDPSAYVSRVAAMEEALREIRDYEPDRYMQLDWNIDNVRNVADRALSQHSKGEQP